METSSTLGPEFAINIANVRFQGNHHLEWLFFIEKLYLNSLSDRTQL